MSSIRLIHGECLAVMRGMPDNSVDSVVCDPPYELGFMNRSWDAQGVAHDPATWREALRVLKPGGYLLAFGGTRTFHRLAVAIEDAGFELRDTVLNIHDGTVQVHDCPWLACWAFGSGFPKSLDVSKAIDKAAGAEREVVGQMPDRWTGKGNTLNFSTDRPQQSIDVTGGPATEAAKQWQGWGTALKPAFEPIVMARKALIGTVAENVLKFGVGGINVDASRVEPDSGSSQSSRREKDVERRHAPEMRSVRSADGEVEESSLAGKTPNDVRARMSLKDDVRPNESELVGRLLDGQENGLPTGQHRVPKRGGQGPDSDASPEGIPGAPISGGQKGGEASCDGRACASHQRSEARQQGRELGRDGLGGALQGASEHREKVVEGFGREQSPKGACSSPGGAVGRWPANLIHDGSEAVLSAFPQASGAVAPVKGTEPSSKTDNAFGEFAGRAPSDQRDGGGSAARFFFCAKTSAADRHEGLDKPGPQFTQGTTLRDVENAAATLKGNTHVSVKPTALMQWLVRLVTPPGGTCLDPYAGSGSTLKACDLEGFNAIGIEREAEYVAIAEKRIGAGTPLLRDVTVEVAQ